MCIKNPPVKSRLTVEKVLKSVLYNKNQMYCFIKSHLKKKEKPSFCGNTK